MSKYFLSFKLEVVQHFLSELEGQKATIKRCGIDHAPVSGSVVQTDSNVIKAEGTNRVSG
ncbi:hypothetical protein ACU6XY_09550 [Klebsiella aerogenes]